MSSPTGDMVAFRGKLADAILPFIAIGCAVGPNYKEPTIEVPAAFGDSPTTAPTTAPSTQPAASSTSKWWTTLNDPELDSLIDRAVLDNRDLKRATSRVREARAQRTIEHGFSSRTLPIASTC